MPDRPEGLTPAERDEWDDWVRWIRENTVKQMAESAFVTQLVPKGETDVKFAVELGLSIMLDKPILALAQPGAPIPPKLRQVADRIIVADLDLEEDRERVAQAIEEFMADFVEEDD